MIDDPKFLQLVVAWLFAGLAIGGIITGMVVGLECRAAFNRGQNRGEPRPWSPTGFAGFFASAVVFWPAFLVAYLILLALMAMSRPLEGGGE